VRPFGVLEADLAFDQAFHLEAVLKLMQINGPLFEEPPQSVDEDIVAISTSCIYYGQCTGKANVTRGIDILTPRLDPNALNLGC